MRWTGVHGLEIDGTRGRWAAAFVIIATVSAQASIELYPSEHSRVTTAESINNTRPWSRSTD